MRYIATRKLMRRWEITGDVRFLTFSCYRKLPLLGSAAIRDCFAAHLARSTVHPDLRLVAWVAMPDHVHLIVQPTGEETVIRMLYDLKRSLAIQVVQRWRLLKAPVLERITDKRGRVRFWQTGGGYDRNLNTEDDVWDKVDYVHANPVEAGLVPLERLWAWSSVHAYDGMVYVGPSIDQPI